jgi:hypothetical protein
MLGFIETSPLSIAEKHPDFQVSRPYFAGAAIADNSGHDLWDNPLPGNDKLDIGAR